MILLRKYSRCLLFFFDTSTSAFYTLPYTTLFRSHSSRPGLVSLTGGAASAGCFVVVLPLRTRSEEHTSELQSLAYLVCRLLLEKKNSVSRKLFCMHRTKLRHQPTDHLHRFDRKAE